MEKDQNIGVVQILVYQEYQELDDIFAKNNLIYCDILEPGQHTLSIPESSKQHDKLVNGIFRRVLDSILPVVELQDIGLMEYATVKNNISRSCKYVLITLQCRSVTHNSVACLQEALHTFRPVRFIDLDEVGHLIEGLKIWRTKPVTSEWISLALDIGATYSGYGFSFQFRPSQVYVHHWYAQNGKVPSTKTSTSVLLDPKGEFHSFGYEAEDTYAELAESSIRHSWRLFRRFKMDLYNNMGLSSSSTVEDTDGRPYLAMQLFTMAIRFLRQHALQVLNKRDLYVKETDIRYVITVPAIWGVPAKQLMRVAATDAGIYGERLQIALEPEAASIWVKTEGIRFAGNKFMLVDLGGETADISVNKELPGGRLQNIHAPSGGPWGGTCVDANFIKFLSEIFGEEAIQYLQREEMCDYLELLRDFEIKKRTFNFESEISFYIPYSLWNRAVKQLGQTIENRLRSLTYGSKVTAAYEAKVKVHPSVVKAWFDDPVSKLLDHLVEILKETNKDVQHIVLVGGFGECRYVQQRIQSELKEIQLVVPVGAGLAVLKGAVVFGHSSELIY